MCFIGVGFANTQYNTQGSSRQASCAGAGAGAGGTAGTVPDLATQTVTRAKEPARAAALVHSTAGIPTWLFCNSKHGALLPALQPPQRVSNIVIGLQTPHNFPVRGEAAGSSSRIILKSR